MAKNKEEIDMEEVENVNDFAELSKDDYIQKLESDLDEQKKKTDEFFEHLKRNMAEFDNFKKRVSKEKESMYYTVVSDVVSNILPILDDFEKALNAECKDEEYKNGMNMIYTSFISMLNKMGVEEIDCLGKTFDPNLHEAVMHEEDDTKAEKEIVDVFRKGYSISGRVVRHSMVKVAN